MRGLFTTHSFKLLTCIAVSAVLVSCSSSRPAPKSSGAGGNVIRSQPGLDINRAHKDGAPWWDVDVNKIPDATPTVHTGNYKANPYTVLGKTCPIQESRNYRAEGTASWYGTKFHGQNTANGEVYDLYGMSAAHKTLPLPAYVKVTNLDNQRSVILRVNDRGPFDRTGSSTCRTLPPRNSVTPKPAPRGCALKASTRSSGGPNAASRRRWC